MGTPSRYRTGIRTRPASRETAAHLGDGGRALAVGLCQVEGGILITNGDGTVVFSNPALEELSGHGSSLVGKALKNLLGVRASAHMLDGARLAHDESAFTMLAELTPPPGAPKPTTDDAQREALRFRVTPCLDAAGRLQHIVASVETRASVTDGARRAAENVGLPDGSDNIALRGSSGRNGLPDAYQLFGIMARVAGEIAHDLNNELSVLLNYSSVLLRRTAENSPIRRYLEEIKAATWRASRLSQGLFHFGQSQRTSEPPAVTLDGAIERLAPLMRLVMMGKRDLDLQLTASQVAVDVPLARFEQLLLRATVLGRGLPATTGPLTVTLSTHGGSGRPPEAVLSIGPIAREPSIAGPLGSDAAGSSPFEHICKVFGRFGTRIEAIPGANDLVTLELRVPTVSTSHIDSNASK